MKPIFYFAILLASILFFSCDKPTIKKRDLVGTWDIVYSEQRTNDLYPIHNDKENFVSIVDKMLGTVESSSSNGSFQKDSSYYLQNYIQINPNYTYVSVTERKNIDPNNHFSVIKTTSRGTWSFLSGNESLGLNEQDRIVFFLNSQITHIQNADSTWINHEMHFADNSNHILWIPKSFSNDEMTLDSESTYTLFHNDHIDINQRSKGHAIYKKRK